MESYADAVYAIIQNSTEHLTAEQIFLRLKEKMPKVVLATVYNNLNRLCANGRVRRISVEGFPDRYDRVRRHDHLLCCRCGSLSDITLDDLTDVLQAQLKESIVSYDLRVGYICPDCRAKERVTLGEES